MCGAFIAGVAVSLSVGTYARPIAASPYRNLSLFAQALTHIESSYVNEVNQNNLMQGAIRGLVATLDPHSAFLNRSEYEMLSSDTAGEYADVGAEVDVEDGWLTVVRVVAGAPADRSDLRPGDRFQSIDGHEARNMRVDQAIQLMRGQPGSRLALKMFRPSRASTFGVVLTREVVRVHAVEANLLGDQILYVRLQAFQVDVSKDLRQAISAAMNQAASHGGIRGLLLDLRDNTGGLLDEAVSVSDLFISQGTIVTTRGRGGSVLNTSKAKRSGTLPRWPTVILINGYTASAAEIVAGCLKDHSRAVIVGTQSFGKGSVQHLIELSNGSALKLTVARYYTPSGVSIQAEGIAPDLVIEDVIAKSPAHEQISESSLRGHLPNEEVRSSGRYKTRKEVRRNPTERGETQLPFAKDFQARTAYQTLRVLLTQQQQD